MQENDAWGEKKVTIGKVLVPLSEILMNPGQRFYGNLKDDKDKISGEISIRAEMVRDENKLV